MKIRFFLPVLVILLAAPALLSAQVPSALLPTADYRIWDTNGNGLGNDPNQSQADALGLTVHVASPISPLTVVTVYENTICSGAPCGVTYWNPETNLFKCYGYSSGSTSVRL
jgi:hypothetical protein